MLEAPRQDWDLHEERCREHDLEWLRGLDPQEGFALYEDLYRLAHVLRGSPEDLERMERRRWREKLDIRARLVEAFRRRDRIRSGRRHPENAD